MTTPISSHEYTCTLLSGSGAFVYYTISVKIHIRTGADSKLEGIATAFLIDNRLMSGVTSAHHEWVAMTDTMDYLKEPMPIEHMVATITSNQINFDHTFLLQGDSLPFSRLISCLGVNHMVNGSDDLSKQMELLLLKVLTQGFTPGYPFTITKDLYIFSDRKCALESCMSKLVTGSSLEDCMDLAFDSLDRAHIMNWYICCLKETHLPSARKEKTLEKSSGKKWKVEA